MSENLKQDVVELAGITMAHTNLLTAMMAVLVNRGLITQELVNEVIDLALVGAETATDMRPDVQDETRQTLESFARTMGGKVR